ncbi:MFS transporter [Bifidobacterium magnum]|uniref:MFS transporter n=1 Tax=Bifidobacterium magnum TaxID=1692 RepID=A0A087BAR7_9BIFI|nr:MFS transporter [Bifidobacterium magnum]KFI68117.1 MFS transporter [Bifidobacterium magnum]
MSDEPTEPSQPRQRPVNWHPGLREYERPGIDDKPDPDEILTERDKAAIGRLGMHMTQKRAGTSSVKNPTTQATKMNGSAAVGGSGLSTLASVDTAVPDEASAFMDMRDPMVSADGHRPTKPELIRLGIGFTVSAIACAIPWVALSSIILPRVLEIIDPTSKVAMVGLINALGSVVALLANIIFGTFSDLTRSRFGKRTPWIVIGGLITGGAIGLIALANNTAMIVFLWCVAQAGYNMMLAPYVATMSDRVPDKVRGTISGFYGAGIAVGQTLGSFVGALLLARGNAGIFSAWMMGMAIFALCGIFVVVVWPREANNRNEARKKISAQMVVESFRPPRHAPDFYYALVGRTLMMGGYWMINTYQLYIAQDYVYAGDPHATTKAAQLIATMAVITLVVSLIAAVTAGPITDKLGMRKIPVALASCLFAVGALMPLLFRSPAGMYLFAAIAGLGYGVYDAIDQALNVAVLPNPKEAGKDLGILNLANTLSTVIGSLLTSVVVLIVKNATHTQQAPVQAYTVVFIVAIVIVLLAAWLITRIKHVK